MLPLEFPTRRVRLPPTLRLLFDVVIVSDEFPAVTHVPPSTVRLELATMILFRPFRTSIAPVNELPVLLRFVPKLLLELKVDVPPTSAIPPLPSSILPPLARALRLFAALSVPLISTLADPVALTVTL